MVIDRLPFIKMRGNETFKIAVKTMEDAVREATSAHGFGIDDVDWLVPHQANVRILKAVGQRLRLPLERIAVNLTRYGNTSARLHPVGVG